MKVKHYVVRYGTFAHECKDLPSLYHCITHHVCLGRDFTVEIIYAEHDHDNIPDSADVPVETLKKEVSNG